MIDAPPLLLLLRQSQKDVCAGLPTWLQNVELISGLNVETINNGSFDLRYSGVAFQCHITSVQTDWRDFKTIFWNPDWGKVISILAINFGDHVGAGSMSPVVVAHLLELSERLGTMLDAAAVLWKPANIVSGFSYFSETVGQYRAGGPFPVLALVDFSITGSNHLVSHGLSWFSGQELQVEPGDLSATELMRRAVRIAHDIAVNGAIETAMEIEGLTEFERIILSPSQSNRELGVLISSKKEE